MHFLAFLQARRIPNSSSWYVCVQVPPIFADERSSRTTPSAEPVSISLVTWSRRFWNASSLSKKPSSRRTRRKSTASRSTTWSERFSPTVKWSKSAKFQYLVLQSSFWERVRVRRFGITLPLGSSVWVIRPDWQKSLVQPVDAITVCLLRIR